MYQFGVCKKIDAVNSVICGHANEIHGDGNIVYGSHNKIHGDYCIAIGYDNVFINGKCCIKWGSTTTDLKERIKKRANEEYEKIQKIKQDNPEDTKLSEITCPEDLIKDFKDLDISKCEVTKVEDIIKTSDIPQVKDISCDINVIHGKEFECNNAPINGHKNRIKGDMNIITGNNNHVIGHYNIVIGFNNTSDGYGNLMQGFSNEQLLKAEKIRMEQNSKKIEELKKE
jgi:hypothetical protein